MQAPAAGRHSTLASSACAALSAESLKCALRCRRPGCSFSTPCAENDALTGIEANYADKSKCAPQFLAYKNCKKSEYEAARAARIKASRGCVAAAPQAATARG